MPHRASVPGKELFETDTGPSSLKRVAARSSRNKKCWGKWTLKSWYGARVERKIYANQTSSCLHTLSLWMNHCIYYHHNLKLKRHKNSSRCQKITTRNPSWLSGRRWNVIEPATSRATDNSVAICTQCQKKRRNNLQAPAWGLSSHLWILKRAVLAGDTTSPLAEVRRPSFIWLVDPTRSVTPDSLLKFLAGDKYPP